MCNIESKISGRNGKKQNLTDEKIVNLESKKIEVLTRYAIKILSGESLEQIAEEEEISVEKLKERIKNIRFYNPALYKQVKEKM
jgi:hypothetical protein